MRLLLIRHGQTPANVAGVLDTAPPGPGLTALGREQAAAIPGVLADRDIQSIAVSNLRRTVETAAPLEAALGVTPLRLSGLREIEAGHLEGASDRESVARYLAVAAAWIRGDRDERMPGGSDGSAFFTRFDAAVAQLAAGGASCAVAVSHGAAIRVWAGATARNVPDDFATRPLENTGIVELDGSPKTGWDLVVWAGEPAGGSALVDQSAPDPTGERL